MHGLFAYISLIFMVNVGKYTHTWMVWVSLFRHFTGLLSDTDRCHLTAYTCSLLIVLVANDLLDHVSNHCSNTCFHQLLQSDLLILQMEVTFSEEVTYYGSKGGHDLKNLAVLFRSLRSSETQIMAI